ncbi:MAG: SdrD B-like domain-containing protein [Acidimicrobiales bacterium]
MASRTFLVCDSWDPSLLRLTSKVEPGGADIPGSNLGNPNYQRAGSNGSPVWLAGYHTGQAFVNDPAQFPDLGTVVEYGTGTAGSGDDSFCDDAPSPAGWHADPNDPAFGNDAGLAAQGVYTGVSRVRLRAVLPSALGIGSIASFQVGLQSAPGLPSGTILPNFTSLKQTIGDLSLAEMLDPARAWRANDYNPATNAGSLGDRLRTSPGVARLRKEVKDPGTGVFGTSTPQFTGGQSAEFRLQPTLSAGITADVRIPLTVEDCLPADTVFQPASSSPAATVVQAGSPVGANLTCGAGETYVRWDLGPVQINSEIPPITYSARVANSAQAGTKINTALVTAEGDVSDPSLRDAQASIQVVQPAGIVVDKVALTPQIEVNRAGETTLDPVLWKIDFANINSDPGPTDVDIIDQLPKQGEDGTSFTGTLAFDSATVTAGDEPGQAVEVLYTRQANVDTDPGNTTNNVTTGSTVWCSLSGGTFTRVLGNGTSAACPTSVAGVTGLRIRRPGAFGPSDQITVEVQMTPSSNHAGDVYVNEVAGRANGLALLVGPALAPATVVASSIGDYVWDDANLNGIQDAGEAPIAGFPVRLTGTDSDGNAVGPLNTTTDANGKYSFTGLQSGSYTVTFLPSGLGADQYFTLQDQGGNDLADSDGDPTTGVATVTLAANTANVSVDQGVFTAAPDIEITKFINGDDANTAPGVLVEPGEDMVVTFEVHNNGNMALDPVVLTDDTIASADITCPKTTLAVDETTTCTAAYPGPDAGTQHTNVATVVGTPVELPNGTQLDDVTDDDPANAYGIVRQVDITKDLVGDPVPNGDGTYTVSYDIVVSNKGTQAATYDLDDELHFGDGATVTDASAVSGPSGVTLNPSWDGAATTRIATGVSIPVDGVHTYRVEATASIDTDTATSTSSDCTVDQGESGTGFLNGATLTFDGEETDVDACAQFPVTTFTKELAGDPVANGDGTYTVEYDIVVTNDGAANDHYDLTDALQFGDGIDIESASVSNSAPGTITTNAAWNGTTSQTIVTDQTIGAGASHTYRVSVVASIDGTITLEQSDCNLQQGEDGTGFLNGATLTVNGVDSEDDACAPAPNTTMTKVLFGDPVVEDDDTVTSTYLITVSNTGAGSDTYDLDDELQYGAGITVNTATVANLSPGTITTNAAWDGDSDTEIVAGQAIASGGTHTYLVTVSATIGTTTTETGADCTLDQGESGTGFLNGATLTVNGETAEDDACGTVDPVIEIDKSLVGTPVRNADGTWEITYDIDVTNSVAPNTYDLDDRLTFGDGIVVEDATVSNTDPGGITTNAGWNGRTDLDIVDGESIGAGVTHTYRVVVTATVPVTATATTTDCTVGSGESGSGFLNRARVTTDAQDLTDDACAEAPNVSIVKDLVGDPVVNDDNSVGLTYTVTVTNSGAGSDAYDLDDELRFGDGITVNEASVVNSVPGDIAVNAGWDGIGDTSVAVDVPIGGAGAAPVVHTYTVLVNATVGTTTTISQADCSLGESEDGTGFLNQAVLTIDEHQTDDDACGEVDPEIVVEKTLAGAPTANGDGTWTVDYELVATNVGPAPGAYDLEDQLAFGDGTSVIRATVEGAEPSTLGFNESWDGINDVSVIADQPIAVGDQHVFHVRVEASVAPTLTASATDCDLGDGEAGTGFLNRASLSYEGGSDESEACAEIPDIHIVKTVKGSPTVSASDEVTVTYELTVTNGGAAAGSYDLSDEIQWGEGLTLSGASVVGTPDGQAASPAWNGTSETVIAEDVLIAAGGTHVWEVRATGTRSSSLTEDAADCELGSTETGTGLLNTAMVSSNGIAADSSACAPVDLPPQVIEETTGSSPIGRLPQTGSQLLGLALSGALLIGLGLMFGGAGRFRRRSGAR